MKASDWRLNGGGENPMQFATIHERKEERVTFEKLLIIVLETSKVNKNYDFILHCFVIFIILVLNLENIRLNPYVTLIAN